MGASKQSLQDFPDFVAAERRYHELQAERGTVQQQLVAIGEEQRHGAGAAEAGDRGRPRVRRSALEVEASRLTTDPLPAEADLDVSDRRTRELEARDRVLQEACRLQYNRVEELRRRYSGEILERHRPAHTALVRDVTEHLHKLGRALLAEQAFRDAREAEGLVAAVPLRPMQLPVLGSLLDEHSSLWAYFREAEEFFGIAQPKVAELREFQRKGEEQVERGRQITREAEAKARARAREQAEAAKQKKQGFFARRRAQREAEAAEAARQLNGPAEA